MTAKKRTKPRRPRVATTLKRYGETHAPALRGGAKAAPKEAKGSAPLLRKHALKLPETAEAPHFDMPSFRVAGKIFATARLGERKAMLKLPRELQLALSAEHPAAIAPVPGTWGARGATFVMIDDIPEALFADMVASAWANAAPKKLRDAHAPKLRKN